MQGVYINGRRPASKKAIREALQNDPEVVYLEATSVHGNEYDGPVTEAPDGRYSIVGPDPYTKRNFYGQLHVTAGKPTLQ